MLLRTDSNGRGDCSARRAPGVQLVALAAVLLAGLAPAPAAASPPDPQVLIYNTEGNRLRRYDADTIDSTLLEDVLQPSESDDPVHGRDSNGSICRFHDGTGRYIHGEDTGQPNPPAKGLALKSS
jgi:hypothetical protein